MLESLARSARLALAALKPSNDRRDVDPPGDPSPPSGKRSVLGTTLAALVLGAVVANSIVSLRRHHQRRLGARPRALPERLQAWEGEGGRPHPDTEHPDNASARTATMATADVGRA
jgi:hypothetical protein